MRAAPDFDILPPVFAVLLLEDILGFFGKSLEGLEQCVVIGEMK